MTKPLLDPIAQKGYAYAFQDWLPKMLENNASAIVGIEQEAQKQKKEDERYKANLALSKEKERIANQRLLASQRPEIAGVYLDKDREDLQNMYANEYLPLEGAATATNALDNPDLFKQLDEARTNIQFFAAAAQDRNKKAFQNEAELMKNPDKYETTVDDLHTNVAGYRGHVEKGGDRNQYPWQPIKEKIIPYGEDDLNKQIMAGIPQIESVSDYILGKPYEVLGQKYQDAWKNQTFSIDPQEIAKNARNMAITDPRAAKTFEKKVEAGQYVKNLPNGQKEFDYDRWAIDESNKVKKNAKKIDNKTYNEKDEKGDFNINIGGAGAMSGGAGSSVYTPAWSKTGNVVVRDVAFGDNTFAGGDILHNDMKLSGVLPAKNSKLESISADDITNNNELDVNGTKYALPIYEVHGNTSVESNAGVKSKEVPNLGLGYLKSKGKPIVGTVVDKETGKEGIGVVARYQPTDIETQPLGYVNMYKNAQGKLYNKQQIGKSDEIEYDNTIKEINGDDYVSSVGYASVRVKYVNPKKKDDYYYDWFNAPIQTIRTFSKQRIPTSLGRETLSQYYPIGQQKSTQKKENLYE